MKRLPPPTVYTKVPPQWAWRCAPHNEFGLIRVSANRQSYGNGRPYRSIVEVIYPEHCDTLEKATQLMEQMVHEANRWDHIDEQWKQEKLYDQKVLRSADWRCRN